MPRLLIHFTTRDSARVPAEPDTLWEMVLSLHWLQRRRPRTGPGPRIPADVARWRTNALATMSEQAIGHQVRRHLLPLAPISLYFPDFLTPYAGLRGLEPGIDTVLSTPRLRIGRELDQLTTRSGAPSWGAELADGNTQALHTLGQTLRGYFATALAPIWSAIRTQIATEHTRLAGIRASRGFDTMLSSLRPAAVWHSRDRVLEVPYPFDWSLHLQGRGLTLIPSWFCSSAPITLADPDQTPVLIYPLAHAPIGRTDPNALAKLIGPTRAMILTTITVGTPTSIIQRRTGVSAAQLSRHVAVLRENNLITEARHAGRTFYTRTPLGDTLTTGQ